LSRDHHACVAIQWQAQAAQASALSRHSSLQRPQGRLTVLLAHKESVVRAQDVVPIADIGLTAQQVHEARQKR